MDTSFSMVFYKQILSKGLTLKDLESVDVDLYNSLVKIK